MLGVMRLDENESELKTTITMQQKIKSRCENQRCGNQNINLLMSRRFWNLVSNHQVHARNCSRYEDLASRNTSQSKKRNFKPHSELSWGLVPVCQEEILPDLQLRNRNWSRSWVWSLSRSSSWSQSRSYLDLASYEESMSGEDVGVHTMIACVNWGQLYCCIWLHTHV